MRGRVPLISIVYGVPVAASYPPLCRLVGERVAGFDLIRTTVSMK